MPLFHPNCAANRKVLSSWFSIGRLHVQCRGFEPQKTLFKAWQQTAKALEDEIDAADVPQPHLLVYARKS